MSEVLALDFPTFLAFVLVLVLVYRFVKPRVVPSARPRVPGAAALVLPPSAAVPEEVVGHVAALWVYPVKGAPGVAVERATVGRRGFVGDRQMMVVRERAEGDAPGAPLSFVSLRNVPELARLGVALDGATVVLRHGGEELRVEPEQEEDEEGAEQLPCRLWEEEIECAPVSAAADAWLSRELGRPLRLVRGPVARMVPEERRDPAVSPHTSLADGYPYLWTWESSLAAVAERAGGPVDPRRFRPNLEVRGAAEPFAEDSYAELQVGSAAFRHLKCCSRCKVPRLDVATGAEDATGQPTRALLELGHAEGEDAFFGVNLAHVAGSEGAVVRLGDPVVLTRRYARSLLPASE